MKIQIICVGKIKEDYLKKLINRYAKEIRKRYEFEIIELPDEKTTAGWNGTKRRTRKLLTAQVRKKRKESKKKKEPVSYPGFLLTVLSFLCVLKGLPFPPKNFRKNGIS